MKLKDNLSTILVIALTSTLLFFSACKGDDQITNSNEDQINNSDDAPITNSAPTCTIISPEDGAEFTQGETISIAVEAEDEDNNLKEVRFYVNDIGISSASSFPYNFDWNTSEEEPGTFTIKAEAIDEAQEKTSDEISITLESSGIVTDIEGNIYNTVIIGNQEWMAENLKTTTYNDGTSIDLATDNTAWANNTTGAYCWLDNDESQYAETFGALYNWHAVITGKLCSDGWHVPTDEEWKILEVELGMSQVDLNLIGSLRGTNEGSKLAGNSFLWFDGLLKEDGEFGTSGFIALPGGARGGSGESGGDGIQGHWWSATEDQPGFAWKRTINYNSGTITRFASPQGSGFCVRCVRD